MNDIDLVKHRPPQGAELEPAVFEAEIVEEPAKTKPGKALAIRRATTKQVSAFRQSERTKRAKSVAVARVKASPRVAVRATYTTALGHVSWSKRLVSAATHGLLREQVRLARLAGDREALADWTDRLEKAKTARAKRVQEMPRLVLSVLGACAVFVMLALVLAVVGALIVTTAPGGMDGGEWWGMLGTALDWLGWLLQNLVVLALWLAVPVLVFSAWREGKRYANPPRWLVTDDEKAELDSVIDERMIALALAHLGIPALTVFFKEGGQLTFTVIPRVDGDGTYAQVKLPMGVTAEQVAEPKPRAKLAANLNRATLETWPTKGDESGVLDLWVADKGKLNAGAGPWPLLDEGAVDAFEGIPFGRSQRGEVVVAPLFECNWLIGGRPGQGKSSGMRTLLLGAALDPTVELWAFVMGESPDFDPFRPRLSRYAMGMDDDVALQALQALRDALAEMERRGKVLGQQPGTPPKTSRKLADKPSLGLHLLVLAIDEVHELYQHEEYGKEAAALSIRLIKRGRKYGIVLVLATQSPTKDSIPREVTRNVSCGVAYSVADHVANDGLLGAGKYKVGIRATDLRMKTDRGTCVSVGITDNVFELVRCFYVPFGDGLDAVTPIINRAVANMRATTTGPVADAEVVIDHLANIYKVMGSDPSVRTTVILMRLAELEASIYEPWTHGHLARELDRWHVPIRKSGNKVVRLDDVADAIANRLGDLDGEGLR